MNFATGPNQGNGHLLTATYITAATSVIAMGILKREVSMHARMPTLTATLIAVPTATPQNLIKWPNLAIRLKSTKTPSQSSLVLSLKTKSIKTQYLLLS